MAFPQHNSLKNVFFFQFESLLKVVGDGDLEMVIFFQIKLFTSSALRN